MIKKILILGIDSLDFDLVNEWDLKNLKQIKYGKAILPINKEDGYYYSLPATPIIWTSFITGKQPKETGVDTIKIYKFPFNIILKHLIYKLPKKEKNLSVKNISKKEKKVISIIIKDKISYIFNKLNISRKPQKSDIKVKTIFDGRKSLHLHIPVYDEVDFHKDYNLVKAIDNKFYRINFEMQCVKEFNIRKNEIFQNLNKDHDIFMQYFFLLDAVQHVYYNNLKKIFKFYKMFDDLLYEIKNKIDDDILILIISDHGQKKGIHTKYGFYSFNKNIKSPENIKLINFKKIINDVLER